MTRSIVHRARRGVPIDPMLIPPDCIRSNKYINCTIASHLPISQASSRTASCDYGGKWSGTLHLPTVGTKRFCPRRTVRQDRSQPDARSCGVPDDQDGLE